ncbi:MAG: tesC [Francisellaceae bacterium]|nr:tesC [Francisellaceae bacterium]
MNNPIFFYPLTIKETYLDSFGHMNNAVYLTLFEEARWEIMNSKSYGLSYIKETGLGPIILSFTVNFLKEIKARDEIIIEIQLISHTDKIAILKQLMKREDEICCQAEFTCGLFDLKQRKLIPINSNFLNVLCVNNL